MFEDTVFLPHHLDLTVNVIKIFEVCYGTVYCVFVDIKSLKIFLRAGHFIINNNSCLVILCLYLISIDNFFNNFM